MRRFFLLTVTACWLLASSGCSSPQSDATDKDQTHLQSDNAELAELHQQDQAERQVENIDWDVLIDRDRQRKSRVEELLAADSVVTAGDHFHAAMILQHGGDSTAYRQAYELSRRSVELDSTNGDARWLTVASYDRYLLSKGQAQWYGTQYLTLNGTTYLRPIDTTQVSDAERRQYGLRTLSAIRAYLTEQNGENRGLLVLPDSIKVTIRG